MKEQYPYIIGWCKHCDQGWLEIDKKVLTNDLLIRCEECEVRFPTPEDALENKNGYIDFDEQITDATLEEIKEKGWFPYLRKEPFNGYLFEG